MREYNVLIVDDEKANIFLLEEYLHEYNLSSVSNAEELYPELEKDIPDIIILDIMMHGTDGFTLAKQLKDDLRYKDIPIIFLSALNSGSSVAQGLNIGAEDYIRKPFDSTELLARVKRVLESRGKTDELYRKATRDNLTGLYNRDYFYEQLVKRIQKSERENFNFSLGILDIDNFKNVNDIYGHQAGDRVLKNLTRFVNKSLREYDILARYGGEEFVFIVDSVLKEQAAFIINRIREQTATLDVDDENNIVVSFSCGITDISEVNDQNDKADALIKISDRRLYTAKSNGRNMVVSAD